ncbi:MAG: hypothetical protein CMP47_14245 [Rickettsiales bacterium]|nr:hypothetical protein [Rickettsiales bacterium]
MNAADAAAGWVGAVNSGVVVGYAWAPPCMLGSILAPGSVRRERPRARVLALEATVLGARPLEVQRLFLPDAVVVG